MASLLATPLESNAVSETRHLWSKNVAWCNAEELHTGQVWGQTGSHSQHVAVTARWGNVMCGEESRHSCRKRTIRRALPVETEACVTGSELWAKAGERKESRHSESAESLRAIGEVLLFACSVHHCCAAAPPTWEFLLKNLHYSCRIVTGGGTSTMAPHVV